MGAAGRIQARRRRIHEFGAGRSASDSLGAAFLTGRRGTAPGPSSLGRTTLVAAVLAGSDLVAIAASMLCAWAIATALFEHGVLLRLRPPLAVAGAPLLMAGVLAYLKTTGRYFQRFPLSGEVRQACVAGFLALLGNAALEFSFKASGSRVALYGTWLLFPVVATLFRLGARAALHRAGLWEIPTLIVGGGELGRLCARALTADRGLGYVVVGQVEGERLHGNADGGLRAVMARLGARFVVIATGDGPGPGNDAIEALVRDNVPFAVAPPLHGLPVMPSACSHVPSHDVVLLSYRNSLLQPATRALKSVFDFTVAAVLLLVASPLLLAITVAVRADGGPALFSHTRIGANGRRFGCLKFRSMVLDADERLQALLRSNPEAAAEWRSRQKLQNDPRITRIGHWLRSTSLDELPQLLNIARGEMSLVGPRPIVESEMVHYGDDINYYYEARPGITGLWQVSGRSDTSYPERVQLDTWYVKNWTLWQDITILARTVPAVLLRRGAV